MQLASRIEQSFVHRLEPLPAETRLLLLLAAAEPVGNATLLWRAAELLGIGPAAVGPAEAAGLLGIGAHVRFRHPLVRSAAYRAAAVPERRDAHRALAEATDAGMDPDRRALHRCSCGRGSRRGGGRRVGEFSGTGAGARGPRRGGGVPGAGDDIDSGGGAPRDARVGCRRGHVERRCVRQGARPPYRRRGGAARPAAARANRLAARADRVRLEPRQRGRVAAARRGTPARVARRRTGARYLPGGVLRSGSLQLGRLDRVWREPRASCRRRRVGRAPNPHSTA